MSQKENEYITEVIINSEKYDLWFLNDREPHSYGISNGESGHLWVKETTLSPFTIEGGDPWIPWLDTDSNRDCWGISISDKNLMKFKHTNYRIGKNVIVNITLNSELIYEISGRGFDQCYTESRTKTQQLKELMDTFGVNLKDVSKEKGRKIYYNGMPATIGFITHDGRVSIKSDYTDVDKDYWWEQMIQPWYNEEEIGFWDTIYKKNDGIIIDILSNDIHWSRNDKMSKITKIKRILHEKGTT